MQLRGVNLGGWLLMETWMCPVEKHDAGDDYSVRELLHKRFGENVANHLLDVYEDAWITDGDLENIQRLGMNAVRVPFTYRTVESEDGQWRDDAFAHLDWVVQHAQQHGMYSILDLHGLPGGQSTDQPTGRVRQSAEHWTDKSNQNRAARIWQRIATHFNGNPAVAGYDLMNEPSGAPTAEALWVDFDRLYRSIRQIDPAHLIMMEGCWRGKIDGSRVEWGLNALPDPKRFGWTNVIYQVHSYDFDWNNLDKQRKLNARVVSETLAHATWNVPVYVGEFNGMAHPEAWTDAIDSFDAHKIHWTLWSYKCASGNPTNSWGIFTVKAPAPQKPDLQHDSADEIARKWAGWNTADAFAPNPMLAKVFASAAAQQQANPAAH